MNRISRGVPRVDVRLVRNVFDSRSQSWIVLPVAAASILFAPRARLLICSAWVSMLSPGSPSMAEKRLTEDPRLNAMATVLPSGLKAAMAKLGL